MKKELFKYPKSEESVVDDFYKEIFFDNEYNRHGAKVQGGDVCIDLGAFVGMFSHYALTRGASKVYSVEINPETYKCLVENTKSNPEIKTFLGEVSDRHDGKNLYSIEGIIKDNNLKCVDFVKMDIENSEYPVLINIKPSTLNKVKKWAIEIHLKWNGDGIEWSHGYDFHSHDTSKLLYIMDKFSSNGFSIALEHIHKQYNIMMLYAWKQ
tara:strand:- start:1593 stop:2222 length:630 start_codon:yes stop_codon:yes gene_type:complete